MSVDFLNSKMQNDEREKGKAQNKSYTIDVARCITKIINALFDTTQE